MDPSSKFRNSKWRIQLGWYLVVRGFWVRWLWNRAQNSIIENGGPKWKTLVDRIKFSTRGFLGSLITNPNSKFRISKRQIQHGGPKFKKVPDWDKFWYLVIFGVADYESERNIQKFKISDAIWRTKMQKAKIYAANGSLRHIFFRRSVFRPNVEIAIFWVADYESDLRFLKFNMADKNLKNYSIMLKICIQLHRVADYESDFRFLRFKMAELRWRQKLEKSSKFWCEFV